MCDDAKYALGKILRSLGFKAKRTYQEKMMPNALYLEDEWYLKHIEIPAIMKSRSIRLRKLQQFLESSLLAEKDWMHKPLPRKVAYAAQNPIMMWPQRLDERNPRAGCNGHLANFRQAEVLATYMLFGSRKYFTGIDDLSRSLLTHQSFCIFSPLCMAGKEGISNGEIQFFSWPNPYHGCKTLDDALVRSSMIEASGIYAKSWNCHC